MKKTLKLISLALVLAFVFMLAVSCAGNDTEEVFDEILYDEDSGNYNFGGQSVAFLTGWVSEWAPEVGYTLMGDNQLARYKEIETKYNCYVDFIYNGDPANYVMQHVAAQFEIPDLLDYHTSQIVSLYESNMLYALDDISVVDLSDDKWGNEKFIRYGNFDGKQYGFFMYDWQFLPAILGVCTFNSYLINYFGLENPQEMLENGTWTWSEFEKMLQTATVTEGDKSTYGLGYDSSIHLAQAVVFSNGGQIVNEEENGSKSSGVTSSNVIDALDWLSELMTKGYFTVYSHERFNNNEMLFFVGESYYFTHMTDVHQNANTPVYGSSGYGFIPFPTGPDGEYGSGGQYVCEGRRLNWIVDAGPMDKEGLGTFLNLLTEPLAGTGEKAWSDFLETNVFHYREVDAQIFMNMVESVHYDWSAELGSVYDSFKTKLTAVIDGKETASSAMGAVNDMINEKLK